MATALRVFSAKAKRRALAKKNLAERGSYGIWFEKRYAPQVKTLIAAQEARNKNNPHPDRIQRKTLKALKAIDAALVALDATLNRCGYIDPSFGEEGFIFTHHLASLGRRIARYAERYEREDDVRGAACSGWENGCPCFACEEKDEEVGIEIEGGVR